MIVINNHQDGLYITDIYLAQVYIHYMEPTTSVKRCHWYYILGVKNFL